MIISKVLLILSSSPFLDLYSKLKIYILFILIKFIYASSFLYHFYLYVRKAFFVFFFTLIFLWNILYFHLFFLIFTNFSISTEKLSLSLNNFFASSLFYLSLNPADHKALPVLLLISQFCICLFQTAPLGLCHIFSLLQCFPNYCSNILIYDIATLIKSTHIYT